MAQCMGGDFSKRVAGSAPARGVESGRRELPELFATVSAQFTAGLGAFMRLTSSKLLPDFERVCAGAAPEQEAMAKLGTEPTVQLLPALTPKSKNFMDVAAQCGAATDDAEQVHKRLRVYLGVAHVVDMLYGKDKQAQAPAPDNFAATVRKLKSLGIWEDMPVALQEELTKGPPPSRDATVSNAAVDCDGVLLSVARSAAVPRVLRPSVSALGTKQN